MLMGCATPGMGWYACETRRASYAWRPFTRAAAEEVKLHVYMDELYARFPSVLEDGENPQYGDIVEVPDELARAYFDTKEKHQAAWDALDNFIDGVLK